MQPSPRYAPPQIPTTPVLNLENPSSQSLQPKDEQLEAMQSTVCNVRTSKDHRSRRGTTCIEAQRINDELVLVESRMQATPCTDFMCSMDLYRNQKLFINGSLTLLELLQHENRRTHARQLPDLHTVLKRTYTSGIDLPLSHLYDMLTHTETMAHEGHAQGQDMYGISPTDVLVEVMECVLCNTYALCACLFEMCTASRVHRACLEWLGDLAYRQLVFLQFVHLAQGERKRGGTDSKAPGARAVLREEYMAWQRTAYYWYGLVACETPNDGHLYVSLAQISDGSDLLALYFFCKSAQVVHRNTDAPALLRTFFSRCLREYRARTEASCSDLAVHLFALLFAPETEQDHPTFEAELDRLCRKLLLVVDNAPHPYAVLETDWLMLSMCCAGAMLQYTEPHASIDVRLLQAYRTSSEDRLSCARNLERVSILIALRTNDNIPYVGGGDGICTQEALDAGLSQPLAHALELTLRLLHVAARLQLRALRSPIQHINAPTAFLILALSFLQVLTLYTEESTAIAAVHTIVRAHLPWNMLLEYALADVFGTSKMTAQEIVAAGSVQLPEDWTLRGVSWNAWSPLDKHRTGSADTSTAKANAESSSVTPLSSELTDKPHDPFLFTTETHMFADMAAISRYHYSFQSASYLTAFVQDPSLQRLFGARHARLIMVLAMLRGQLAPTETYQESCPMDVQH
ncbi:hypothetical protein MVES1_003286 [Malassezia vespertilionis]|uniref:DNA/RNA-binding domain-containing protein n=1 Tax=Malassezia vespertilionis TaxID=2020962 RepID=A0A2N1J6W4_9BASI|nr:uncharacterized protein MVES1_003286 [Malassezia vespertilionis]PKI82291.1 hypothetical protein MVES_003805 [Malassezia vespertilionis]WFD07917.1 hypothetical protein MVES1_003286 [Malassezia vespertilionis]